MKNGKNRQVTSMMMMSIRRGRRRIRSTTDTASLLVMVFATRATDQSSLQGDFARRRFVIIATMLKFQQSIPHLSQFGRVASFTKNIFRHDDGVVFEDYGTRRIEYYYSWVRERTRCDKKWEELMRKCVDLTLVRVVMCAATNLCLSEEKSQDDGNKNISVMQSGVEDNLKLIWRLKKCHCIRKPVIWPF